MNLHAPSDHLYVGFWPRLAASLLDSLILMIIIVPVLLVAYPDYWTSTAIVNGPLDFLVSWVLPAVAVILFWVYRGATPGKMAFEARIVDAMTGNPATTGQLVGRYFGYFVSTLPLLLGFLWVAFDSRKQGFHDKLAGTVVVRPAKAASLVATFPSAPPHPPYRQ